MKKHVNSLKVRFDELKREEEELFMRMRSKEQQVNNLEKQILKFKKELVKVETKLELFDCSILTGSLQRFETKEVARLLRLPIEECEVDIIRLQQSMEVIKVKLAGNQRLLAGVQRETTAFCLYFCICFRFSFAFSLNFSLKRFDEMRFNEFIH